MESNRLLYNVTIKVEHSVEAQWIDWMKKEHVPAVMSTGCFESFKMTKILGDDDEHGVGYAVQYIANNQAQFDIYQERFAKSLQSDHAAKFEGKYVAFRTLMAIVDEG